MTIIVSKDMDFGGALHALKKGRCVARTGWNGKGMFLWLVRASDYDIRLGGSGVTDDVRMLSWIGMKTADNGFVPWLASQTDVLASDWCVVE